MSNSLINIKVLPALNGESILIEISGKVFLIDGGYVNTYNEYIYPELKKLSEKGFEISHIIASHIDGDHISGLIKFLDVNIDDQIMPVNNIWHNSFRHIQHLEEKESLISVKGIRNDINTIPNKSYLKKFVEGVQDISAEQGSSLGALILKGNYKWNEEFNGNAVSIDNIEAVQVDNEITIRILSPNNIKLSELKTLWNRELYKKGYTYSLDESNYDDAFEFLIAQEKEKKILIKKNISQKEINIEELSAIDFNEDTSISNGSSISFVLETKEKRLLFLGDSHPSLIIESLKKQYSKEKFPLEFDLIKLSHHGCVSNTSKELLELIDSPNYIISTDGSVFKHPNIETIARVINRRTNYIRRLHFNYALDIVNKIDDKEVMKTYSFEIHYPMNNLPLEIILE